jgi:hypothetical protein
MLAREPAKRPELLRALADALCDRAPGLAADDRMRFDDAIATMLDATETLLDDIEPVARREFAERLAAHPAAPRRVMARLAGDVAAVAAPVLTGSPVLDEDDLAGLARDKSQDHLLAIARRDRLSERITDILIERGDAAVLDCLAENPGARFSASGAAALIDRARSRETLRRRLAGRRSVLAETAGGATDGGSGTVGAAGTAGAAEAAGAAGARPLDELADRLADGTLRLSDAVIELADADRAADLAVLVCRGTRGNPQAFLRHLFAPDEMALIAACRAAELDLESFSAVMRLHHRHHPSGTGDIGRLLRAFQELPAAPARGPQGDGDEGDRGR